MGRFLHFNLPAWRCKQTTLFLACAYIFGLISGVLFSMSASDALSPTMRAAVSGCVSISGLLSAILLPLLFSALAVYISQPWLLIPIAFCKAFLFAFTGIGVWTAFGSAGWLVRLLLMFGDSLMLPFLWWYWYRALNGQKYALRCTVAAAFFALLIGSIDYCVISPFLANLISY